MGILIIYGTTHNTTKKIVHKIEHFLDAEVVVFDVSRLKDLSIVEKSDVVIFVSPTYGDAELQIDMENFLVNNTLKLEKKPCIICETGNYDGVHDLFGSSNIMKYHLDMTGCTYLAPSLSLDTLPKIDWDYLEKWCKIINTSINNYIIKSIK